MKVAWIRSSAALGLLGAVTTAWSYRPEYFAPEHRMPGIGIDRANMPSITLHARTQRMIDSMTFSIMREPDALIGAERITKLRKVFDAAAKESGFPASTLSAISYLESFGNPKAESPAGPKGIMQFSESTGRAAGLQVVRVTKYRTSTVVQQVKNKKGKLVSRTVRTKVPYTVTVRDDRLIPERAIPAAGRYLARMSGKFGRQDWAIFAYHCGEGCVSEMQPMTEKAVKYGEEASVAAMFFSGSPVNNKQLYTAVQYHMQRDYSPTYWFRVTRAEQLLRMYWSDPGEFKTLWNDYRNDANPEKRADHRLVVWLKGAGLPYRSGEDLRKAQGKGLVQIMENPGVYGFAFQPGTTMGDDPANLELYRQASPSTIGTLAYIAYETRRLFEALHPPGQQFVPLRVTELVSTMDLEKRVERGSEVPVHCTGMVFDISIANLSAAERECLNFILDEMGWDGFLGFIQDNNDTIHIGCSPGSRDFFTQVYQDAAAGKLQAAPSGN